MLTDGRKCVNIEHVLSAKNLQIAQLISVDSEVAISSSGRRLLMFIIQISS